MQQQFTPYQVQEMRNFFDPTKKPSETFNELGKRLNLSDLDIQDWFYDNQDYIKKQEELHKKSQVTPTQVEAKSQHQAQSSKQATQQDYKAQLQDKVAQGVIRAQLKKTMAEIEPMPLEEVRARLDVLLGAEEMRQFETHIRTVAYHRMWTKAQIDAEIDKSCRHRLEHYKEYQKYLPERVETKDQTSGRPDQAQTQEASNSAQNLAEVEDEHLKELLAFAKKLSCDQLFSLVKSMTENKDQVLRQVMEKAAEKVMKKLEAKKQAKVQDKAQGKEAEKTQVKDSDQAKSDVQAKPRIQAQLQEKQQFTPYQVQEMRRFFDPTKKPSETFNDLSKRLNLSDLDIQDWFYDNQDYIKKQEEQKYLPERVEAKDQTSGQPNQAQSKAVAHIQAALNVAQNQEDEHLKEVLAFTKKLSCDQLFALVASMKGNTAQVLIQVVDEVMKMFEAQKQAQADAQEKHAEKTRVKDLDQAQSGVQAKPHFEAQLQVQQQFTPYQVQELRKFFDPTRNFPTETLNNLGKRLGLSDLDIQDWFYDNQDYLKKQKEQAKSGAQVKPQNKAQPQGQDQPDVQAKPQVQNQPLLSEEQQSMAKVLLHVYAVSQNKISKEPTDECKEQARARLQALSPYLAPRQLKTLTHIVNSSEVLATKHPHFETLLVQHEMLNQAQKLMEAEQKIQKLEEEKRDLEHELEAQADQIDEAYSSLEAQSKALVQANQDLKAQNKAHEKEKAELKMEIQEVKEAWRVSQTLMKTMMQEAVDLRKSKQAMQKEWSEIKLSAENIEKIFKEICEDFPKTKEINLNLKSQIDKMSKDNQLAVQDSAKKDKKLAEMEVYVSKLKGMIHYMDQDLSEFENKEIIQKWKLAEKEKELVEMEKKVAKLEEELRKKNDEIEFLNEDW